MGEGLWPAAQQKFADIIIIDALPIWGCVLGLADAASAAQALQRGTLSRARSGGIAAGVERQSRVFEAPCFCVCRAQMGRGVVLNEGSIWHAATYALSDRINTMVMAALAVINGSWNKSAAKKAR